jgi:hypothetical protein
MFIFVEVFGKKLESSEFSALRFPLTMFTLQTSFKPFFSGGRGGGVKSVGKMTMNSKEENS